MMRQFMSRQFMSRRCVAGVASWRVMCVLGVALVFAPPTFGQSTFTWSNSPGNNNFADASNWNPVPTSFTVSSTGSWIINSLGGDRAIISTEIVDLQRDLLVGEQLGGRGELAIQSGGSVTVARLMRLGRGGGTTGYGDVTVNGGSLTVTQDIFVGQSDRPENIFRLQSGTVSTRGVFVASASSSQGVLDISGGSFNVSSNAFFSDGSSAPSTSFLNLSGTGALAVSSTFSLAQNSGTATATATIKDTAALSALDLRVGNGRYSTATLNIKDNATLTATDLRIGNNRDGTATFNMEGDATITTTNLRIGFGRDSTTTLNIDGGTINATTGFTTFGENIGANVTVNMTGGVLNAERINWANFAATDTTPGASATLNMSGGVINVVRQPDSTNSTSGAFGLRAGEPEIFLTADAVVNAQRLLINDGGTLDLDGAAVMNVTGATDGRATFDFLLGLLSDDWETVKGKINFSSLDAVLQVTGTGQTITDPSTFTYTFADLFTQAIANGVITKNVAGSFQIDYDAVNDLTTLSVVPEPSSAMLALGGLVLLGLSARGRRIQCR
jgi:hypothetical protein